MYMLNDLPDSVFAPEPDTLPIQRLEAMLEKAYPKLVGLDGEEIMLPDSIYQALRQVIHMMASGQVISLVPYNLHLSTIQASDLLNVSRGILYFVLLRLGCIVCIGHENFRRGAPKLGSKSENADPASESARSAN